MYSNFFLAGRFPQAWHMPCIDFWESMHGEVIEHDEVVLCTSNVWQSVPDELRSDLTRGDDLPGMKNMHGGR